MADRVLVSREILEEWIILRMLVARGSKDRHVLARLQKLEKQVKGEV